MEIQIGDNYKITSDAYNVILNEKRKTKSKEGIEEEKWFSVSYHPNLEQACVHLINRTALHNDSRNVKDLLNELKQIKSEIVRAVSGVKK